jgi:pSer/pThr/pTyr-binding forkhead associated (FHA) protein
MIAKLFCRTGQLAGAEYTIRDEATIGKNPTNTVVLYPAVISGNHARIFFDKSKNCYYLEDLKSKNGTKLDGVRVTARERLDKLNVITFAGIADFIFQRVQEELPVGEKVREARKRSPETVKEQESPPVPAIHQQGHPQSEGKPEERGKTVVSDDFIMPPKILESDSDRGDQRRGEQGGKTVVDKEEVVLPGGLRSPPIPQQPQPEQAQPVFTLEYKDPAGDTQTFTLQEGENVVGRSPSCQIHINDSSMSRDHAVITVRSGKATVRDSGSKNHTFVDGKKITSEEQLRDGSTIAFGLAKAKITKGTSG